MIEKLVAVGAVMLVIAGVASAGSALPRKTVDAAFRKAELAAHGAFPAATLTCTWNQGTAAYGCITWKPSATSTGVIVAGKNATVYRRRSIQACAKTQAGIAGCSVTTLGPSCHYALTIYSGSAALVRMVNVCRPGWVASLR